MDRIYTIIQKEKMKRVSDEILTSLDKGTQPIVKCDG